MSSNSKAKSSKRSNLRKHKKGQIIPLVKRTLSIRTQLMLFLCFVCFVLLAAVWIMSTSLLQPRYNASIESNLTTQLNSIVAMMDEAIENDISISTRKSTGLVVNEEFRQQLDEAIAANKIKITNICVDISDTSLNYVMYSENVQPCVVHSTTSYGFASTHTQVGRDSENAYWLRRTCFSAGSISHIVQSGELQQMVVGKTTADGQYVVLLSASLARVEEAGSVLQGLLPGTASFLLLLAFIAAWLFSRWFTKPISRLSAASHEMAEGNYDVKLDSSRSDELGTLSKDFNNMAEKVKHSAQLQRELIANVSHDLRTPLTLIKGYAETVRDITGDNEQKRNEQMGIIIDESDRLSGLVGSVMELSKVSSGAEQCKKVRFDLRELCEEVAERYVGICTQNNWKLILEMPEDTPLMVNADPAMLERALHNLLGNAMHHIGADGIFVLRGMSLPNNECRIEIEDHGEGIKQEDLPYIFDRYYRSRADFGKVGTGLGLSITKAIFQQHGYQYGVISTFGKGTTFWFIA